MKLVRDVGWVLLAIVGSALAQTNAPFRLLEDRTVPTANAGTAGGDSTNSVSLRTQAFDAYDKGDYGAAQQILTGILRENPKDSRAAWTLGCACYYMEDYPAAVVAYDQYVKLRPKNADGHLWLGTCLSRAGNLREAEKQIRAALQINPAYTEAYDELAYLFECLTNSVEAAENFSKAIQFGGETPYRCVQAGTDYARAGNYTRATVLLEHALGFEPTNVTAAEWLGYSQFYLKQYGQALATFQRGLKMQPTNFFFRSWMGHTYLRLKKYDLAADSFREAAAIDPNDRETRESVVYALFQAHRFRDAIRFLEQSIHQNPGDKKSRQSLLGAYLLNNDYKKAGRLYPVLFPAIASLLGIAFLIGSLVLLRKSFSPSISEYPHLAFAISWLVLFFESQIALVIFAGLFTASKLIVGVVLAPLPLLAAAFGAFPKQPWGRAFKRGCTSWKHVGFALIGWIAIALITAAYSSSLYYIKHVSMEPRNVRFLLVLVRENRLLAPFVVVVLAPVTEEVLFRGLLFGALSKWLKPVWTVLITAALFAAIHMDAMYFLPLFLIGVLLGWARSSTKAIWFPACIHMCQNAIAFIVWMVRSQ